VLLNYRYFSVKELEVLQTEHELIGRPTFYMHPTEQNQRVDHAAYVPECGTAPAHRTGGSVLDTKPHQVDPFVHMQKRLS
jgi:hypothetical protein